jgi:type IV secretion system protein VirD4
LKKNSSQIFQKNIDELTCGSVLFFGGAGSYKTANIIKPTILKNILCENTPSMIVTDPKGELFDSTSYYAQQKGYKVYRFNPSNYINSHK